VLTRQLVTKEEILHLAGYLEKDEIFWLQEQMALMTKAMATSRVSRVGG